MKIAVAALVLALSAPAFAGLVTNGGFETLGGGAASASKPLASGFFAINSGDSTSLPGWTVGANGIEVVDTYFAPNSGTYSIDLNQNNSGTLTWTGGLATVVGQLYELRFWMAGNAAAGPAVKSMNVTVGATTFSNVSFDTTGHSVTSRSNMGWTEMIFQWTATTTSDALVFTDTTGFTSFGVALDDISVNAVPEPATFALFGAGLGALGLWRRRVSRKARASAKSQS